MNEELFFKVFRNCFLFNEILNHLKLYNLHESRSFNANLKDFKYKDYIKSIYNFSFTIKNQFILSNFKELTSLSFAQDFNKKLLPNSIPNTIKSIKFNKKYKQSIQENILPTNLEYLSFSSFYDLIPSINIFPNSITTLIFDDDDDQDQHGSGGFNFELTKGILPNSLTILNLARNFNTILNRESLPNSITNLKMNGYNQPLEENVLPDNLKELILNGFARDFNENTFSNCKQINKLVLKKFNQPLGGVNVLPNSLTHLEVLSFNQIIMDESNNHSLLPTNLKYLDLKMFQCSKEYKTSSFLPNSIETLIVNENWLSMYPKSLTSITFSHNFTENIDLTLSHFNSFKNINLNHCCLRSSYTPSVHLIFQGDSKNTKEREHFNPINIKTIELNVFNFTWSKLKQFKYLKEIIFDKNFRFNQSLSQNILPNTLERLEFGLFWNNGGYYNSQNILVGFFPNSIKYLKFGGHFNTTLTIDVLPTSLIHLTLPKKSLFVIPKNTILKFKLTLIN